MKIDMNNYRRHIVEKDGRYLVGCVMSGVIRYSANYYDAWFTNNPKTAWMVARKIGGTKRTFNYLTGVFE